MSDTRVLQIWFALILGSWQGSAAPVSPQQSTSAATWFALISDIARIGANNVDTRAPTDGGGHLLAAGLGGGAGSSGVIIPPPIKLNGADGVTALQLVIVPVPTATQQCDARAPLTTRPADVNVAVVPETTAQYVKNIPPLSQLSQPGHRSQPSSGSVDVSGVSDHFEEINHYPGSVLVSSVKPVVSITPRVSVTPPVLTETLEFSSDPIPTSTPSPKRISVLSRPDSPSSEQLRRARDTPYFPPVENSGQLLQQFLAQVPPTPHLQPLMIPQLVVTDEVILDLYNLLTLDNVTITTTDSSPRPTTPRPTNSENGEACGGGCKENLSANFGGGRGLPDPHSDSAEKSPPLPAFESSVKLEAVLVLPRAGYSERYTLWWQSNNGAYRWDYHNADGSSSSYRMPIRGGSRAQYVFMNTLRTGETDVRVCTVLPAQPYSLAQHALPALPSTEDLRHFVFSGYIPTRRPGVRVERWRRVVRGSPVGGETLTYRHELLVSRSSRKVATTPLRYAVSVDSSLLGKNCDSYMHIFERVVVGPHDPAIFRLSLEDVCDQTEITDNIHLMEPLREFTMLQRDPRYDGLFRRFQDLYKRKYADNLEEAIRKLLLISTIRFVSSGNRQGATFVMEAGFLADRLKSERRLLLGVDTSTRGDPGETFPHSAKKLKALRGHLPKKFSWLQKGFITPVRSQGSCQSCWAFAVTGAIEGAFFAKTKRLVSLSEQSLLDCGGPYKTRGCKPTWPNFAYTYAEKEGMHARDEYPSYKAKVSQCEADQVPIVTYISGHVSVTNMSITALKVALQFHGPTIVLIDGLQDSFMNLKEGYYDDAKCDRSKSNHAVLAVAYKERQGITYFRVKNSWGDWAEGGYAWMRANNNMCGILNNPSYPRLKRKDVKRIPRAARTARAT